MEKKTQASKDFVCFALYVFSIALKLLTDKMKSALILRARTSVAFKPHPSLNLSS